MRLKYVMLLCTLLCSVATYAIEVPASVKNAFQKKFPKAVHVKWSKENASEYEADFAIGKTAMSANFDTSGKWLETETTIRPDELPQAVSNAVKKLYPKFTLTAAAKIETQKNVRYEAELKSSKGSTIEKEFLVDGRLVN